MTLNIILSHTDDLPQEMVDYEIAELPYTALSFALHYFSGNGFPATLAKMSLCIKDLEDTDSVPGWYLNCEGKLYFEGGKLI